jgi:Universal stress protein UspA and related nucleotide-binding proteins
MKILLAIDGSTYSNAAIQSVARRPWPNNTKIKVVMAVEMPSVIGMEPWATSPEYFEQLEIAIRDAAKEVIDGALQTLKENPDKTLKVDSEIIQGPPRQVIVEEAERWNADLIVMGSRGLGAWNRLLLGSVSSGVIHHAKCSVEIVRERWSD